MPPTILDTTGAGLYEQADRLRESGPAVPVRLPGDLTAWSVSRGDVVRRLLTHPDVSKNARTSWPGYRPYAIAWLTAWVDLVSMFTSDGADHRRLRELVGRAFTVRRIEALRPAIQKIADGLLDGLAALPPDEPVDLRARFSYQVPTQVICDLFGVPEGQRPSVLRVMDGVQDNSLTQDEATVVQQELFAEMDVLLAHKRAHPGDDLTSVLLAEQQTGGDRLSLDELVSTLLLMIGAGSETTVALIDNAIVALLSHPDQLATVTAAPERWPDAIEETLRAHPPVMHLPLRYATADIDLGDGLTIGRGDLILICFGAHGRDPGANPDPGVFDVDRHDRQHLAFGHGVHFCLGAPLARLEAAVALPALFARFPALRLAAAPGTLPPLPSFTGNDVRTLPVLLGEPVR